VHGTTSARTLGEHAERAQQHRLLRDRFQYWFFFYGTETRSLLRDAAPPSLTDVVERLDPEHRDPALQQMVIIGHSQGGLVARMTAITSGEHFWQGISRRPIDDLDVSEETRSLLRKTFFFEPLPFVRQLVFIATPHRGSHVAEGSIANLFARFVQLPQTIATATAELAAGNPDALAFDPRRPVFGSVYGMRPGSRLVTALEETSIDPRVRTHSIIPIRGDLPPDGQSDGFVRYESAHLDGVESELIIPRSGHSVQSNPLAIEEVRRILAEHADEVCRESHVACRTGG
jgi:pimeloyl-ACP methyl ester carboxylesterase